MKKGDWIYDGCGGIGKAKSDPYEVLGRTLVDVTIYALDGRRIGRESPAMGGPRHFEPACGVEGWTVIAKPGFPLPRFLMPDELAAKLGLTPCPADTTGEHA
jgi:hypothetical protein